MEIQITGMTELVARMKSVSAKMTGPSSRRAVRAGGAVIQAAMVERAPLKKYEGAGGNSLAEGELKGDIKVYTSAAKGEVAATIGPGGKTAHVARWIEYGHRMVTGGQSKVLANGKTRGKGKVSSVDVPAYPFLRPAFESSVEGAQSAMVDSYRQDLAKVGS